MGGQASVACCAPVMTLNHHDICRGASHFVLYDYEAGLKPKECVGGSVGLEARLTYERSVIVS